LPEQVRTSSQLSSAHPRHAEQRVAIIRAIVTDPTIILADEPTGNVDARSAEEILTLLRQLNEQLRKTITLVTPDVRAAQDAKNVRHLDKGALLPPGIKAAGIAHPWGGGTTHSREEHIIKGPLRAA
jgi:ABC-type lipoprotein export system ATPase subunit